MSSKFRFDRLSRLHQESRVQNRRRLSLLHLEDRTVPTIDLTTTGMIAGEILVQYQSDTNVQQRALNRMNSGAQLAEEISSGSRLDVTEGTLERVLLPSGMTTDEAVAWYNSQPGVAFAEPNYRVSIAAVSNDPYYTNGSLWGLYGNDSPTAVGPSGTTNQYGIAAEKAWNDGFTGSSSVYVGVVDTGVQVTHPDLVNNIWVNPYDPVDGIDNDGNGYVDDVHGWDFYNNDNSVYDDSSDDHGTHVAGTIGGQGGNGAGVAGVNWDVTIISTKFLGPYGGSTADAVRAIDYLTDLKLRHGINLVATNNSWGGGGYSQALNAAVNRSAKADILFVAAAGNSSYDNDYAGNYPSNLTTLVSAGGESAASYEGVIAVASLNSGGGLSYFSNFGATTVDIAAPGSGIVSTVPNNAYASYSGTSMATPHVTGAIALYASVYPNATAEQIRNAILETATPTASLSGITVTGGRLNVYDAIVSGNTTPPPPNVPSVSIADATVTEGNSGNTNIGFTVSLSQPTDSDVTFQYATVNGSAIAGVDYVNSSGTATIPAGSRSVVINVPVIGDTTLEPNENFRINLSALSSNAVFTNSSAFGTILDDDNVPPPPPPPPPVVTPSVSVNDVQVSEGDSGTTSAIFTVSLDQAGSGDVTVTYDTMDSTAVSPGDYQSRSGSLTIPAGSTSATIAIAVNGDSDIEADETFQLVLSSVSSNAVLSDSIGIGTIINDDTAPPPPPVVPSAITIDDVQVIEGDSGTSEAVFTVSLDQASSTDIYVDYYTYGVTASGWNDYESQYGTLVIAAGTTSAQITVPVYGDVEFESDETFELNLYNATSNAVIADALGIGTILNDDANRIVSLSVGDIQVVEGDSGIVYAEFPILLSQAASSVIYVNYMTGDGSASMYSDYGNSYGYIMIPAGSTSATISVPVYGDTQLEPDETFSLYIYFPSSNAVISDYEGVCTIVNDDAAPPPQMTVNNVRINEGNSGTRLANFTVSLDTASDTDTTVDYYTYGVTATAGVDYEPQFGTLVIPAGATTGTISVPVYGDTEVEANEKFELNLYNASANVDLVDDQGICTIRNDDTVTQPTVITASDASVSEGNRGRKNLTFTLTRSGDTSQTSTLWAYTTDQFGTASEWDDYQGGYWYVQFNPGETSKTISVKVYGDRTAEDDETFSLMFVSPTNASLAVDQVIGTILNDDSGGRSLSLSSIDEMVNASFSIIPDQPVTDLIKNASGKKKS